MCDEGVDDSLTTLKLILNWFVTSKVIKKLYNALYADEIILYFDDVSGDVVFNCNGMGILNIDLNILNIDLNNINLDENYDGDDPDTIIFIRLLAWHIKFRKYKELKKS